MRLTLSALAFLLALTTGYGQVANLQQLRTDVVYLASDYLEGRETGRPGEQLAADYIAWRMEAMGLSPKGTAGFMQPFTFTQRDNPHAATGTEITGTNVVGYLDKGAAATVVIGAHYDHLGLGGVSSLDAGEPAVHNGADDNASGVAALLWLAGELAKPDAPGGNNYLFIAFSGEELGLIGSKRWTEQPTVPLDQISYMFNMDMVGRLNPERTLAVYGTGTSPVWDANLERIATADGFKLTTSPSGVGPSDHTSFYLKDIPVLHFFTGQHREYHKPTDDVHLINFVGIYQVARLQYHLIQALDRGGKPAFTATAQDDKERQGASFKVTLGVMPDYVHAGTGMRVDAVLGGRAGEKAGMKDGDVVIGMGDMEITDIYGYMEALSKFKAGDETTVKVQRGEEVVELPVVF